MDETVPVSRVVVLPDQVKKVLMILPNEQTTFILMTIVLLSRLTISVSVFFVVAKSMKIKEVRPLTCYEKQNPSFQSHPRGPLSSFFFTYIKGLL